jgi:hypothetical protein
MTTAPTQPASAGRQALQRHTRRPTGKPSWPILLIAGAEKAGKSWACAAASGSPLIHRTLWIGIGEDDPDEYGNVPDADFEIVEHDGTYRDLLAAVEWAAAQPAGDDGRPNLIVLDSMSRLWDLLCDMAQDQANARARRKQQNPQSRQTAATDDTEADIHMDLWNIAKSRWSNVMDALRAHQGPALVTARLDEVTVMVGGKPTQQKELKVKAEKSLPYDVGGVIQLPERGKAFLTGVRTTRMQIPERVPLPGFTVEKLWRNLGLADTEVGNRTHSGVNAGRGLAPVEDIPAQDRQSTRQPVQQRQAPAPVAEAAPPPADEALADLASTVATRAGASKDVEEIRRTYTGLREKTPEALKVDVAADIDPLWAAAAGVTTPRVELGAWLIACGNYVKSHPDMAVADGALDPALTDTTTTADASATDTTPLEG